MFLELLRKERVVIRVECILTFIASMMRSMRLSKAAPKSIIKANCATAAGSHASRGNVVTLDLKVIACSQN